MRNPGIVAHVTAPERAAAAGAIDLERYLERYLQQDAKLSKLGSDYPIEAIAAVRDVVISRIDTGPAVLLNESKTGRWLGLELVGTHSNRTAIGAPPDRHAVSIRRAWASITPSSVG